MMGAFLTWVPSSGFSLSDKALYFDAVTDETQTFKSTATEHPVEDGANITDHVRKELDTVSLEVFVSNSPIFNVNDRPAFERASVPLDVPNYSPPLAPTPGAVFGAIGSAIKGLFSGPSPNSAVVTKWLSSFDAVAETLATLEKLRDDAQLITVVTPKRSHDDMLLESIEIKRNAGTGDGATFALAFKQIKKVQVSIVGAPIPTEPRGHISKPKGAQPATPAKAPDKKKSVLKGAFGR